MHFGPLQNPHYIQGVTSSYSLGSCTRPYRRPPPALNHPAARRRPAQPDAAAYDEAAFEALLKRQLGAGRRMGLDGDLPGQCKVSGTDSKR